MAASPWSHSHGIAVLTCILIFSNGVESASPVDTTSNNGESTSTTSGSTSATVASAIPSSIDGNASSTTTASNTSSLTGTHIPLPQSLSTFTSITTPSIQSLSSSDSNEKSSATTASSSSITARAVTSSSSITSIASSSRLNSVTSQSLSHRDGNATTSENRSSTSTSSSSSTATASQTSSTNTHAPSPISSTTVTSTSTAPTSSSISHSTTSIKSSPEINSFFSSASSTGFSSILITVNPGSGTTTTSSTASRSGPIFLATNPPSSTFVLSTTSADSSLSSTPLSAATSTSSSRFWNNRASVIAIFVMIALIALGVIGACLFAFFKRRNSRRRVRYESFTDVVAHSRDPSSIISPLNVSPQEKHSSNVPSDAPRLSFFPFSFRQTTSSSKRESALSIDSFFSGPIPQPQIISSPVTQEKDSSTIPDVLPDIPFSFWTPKRESADSFFGGPDTPTTILAL